ncbi:MAG: hypothetical protein PVF74_11915, partial [Anaerolineales bacterium]
IRYLFLKVDDFVEIHDRTHPIIEEYGTPAQRVGYLGALGAHDNLKYRFAVSEQAVLYSRKAMETVRQTGNMREVASRQFSLGFNLLFAGDLQDAEVNLLAAYRLGNKLGDAWIQTASLNYLAICYRLQSMQAEVREYAQHALVMAQRTELNAYIGMSKANLGWADWKNGEFEQTEARCIEALSILKGLTNPFNWCALFPLTHIAVTQGEFEKAVDYLTQLLDPRQMRLPDELSHAAEGGIAAWNAGRQEDVNSSFRRTLELAEEYGFL